MDGYVSTTSLGNSNNESEENEIVENIGNAKLACKGFRIRSWNRKVWRMRFTIIKVMFILIFLTGNKLISEEINLSLLK